MTTTTNALEIEELEPNQSSPDLVVNEGTAVLDAAVGGQITINFSANANYSIQTVGLKPQEWQYSSIIFTDTGVVLTTGRDVIWPSKNRRNHFSFKNATARTLTVKRSGQTGYPVGPGANVVLRDNGTDIELAFSASNGITGPGSSTNGNFSLFSGSLGAVLSDSGKAPSTDGTMASNSDAKIPTEKAVRTYVASAVVGLLDLKGDTDASANPNYPSALKGDAYYVTVAGKVGGASGKSVDIGDVYVAKADNAGGTEASVGTSWFVLEHNLAGALLAANNLSDLTTPATALTNLGGTTVGKALFTLSNPNAIRFIRINADNSVTARTAAELLADIVAASTTSAINTQTVDYTLVLADGINTIVEMNKATAVNLTIPPNSAVAFPVGTSIPITQIGAGQVTVVAGSGVTIRSKSGNLKITTQYCGATIYKRATDEWVLIGDLAA